MQAAALRVLEFDRIREALAREALTPVGRTRVLALEPADERDAVRALLALASEAAAFVADGGNLGISAPDTLAEIVLAIEIGEDPLDPPSLLGLARFVTSVADVAAGVSRPSDRKATGLRELGQRAPSFADEAEAIDRAIEPGGEVRDQASAALRDIREGLRRQRAKLRTTLESLIRGRETAKYLQDQIVSDRHGRYVVVVRAEHRDAVPGIVHGSSTSGASLYVEPINTVPLNNDIVELAEREREEVRRILLSLTNAFRRRRDDLDALLDVTAELDELHAKTALARRWDGVAPVITDEPGIEFLGARHPLLSINAGSVVIPSDLRVAAPTRALVISGPNTGGKTVALKAFGLLALMAQAGVLIPVERGSRLGPLRSVFADIGDEQSISASLSTFSAHIASIVEMERALEQPALVLLDEVGGGTDPAEGGALGTAIIDHFRRRGALVVATTHDEALKSYASTTDGVMTASFGFDPANYAPTYRLLYGAPGRSLALEVAERLGIPAAVVADARSRRSGRESLLAEHLARVDAQLAAIDRDRAGVADERRAMADERQRLLEREARLAEREAVLRKRLDDKVNEKLREARVEVDRIVGQLKQKAEAIAEKKTASVSTGDVGSLKRDARTALDSIGEGLSADGETADAGILDAPPNIGQRVFVTTVSADGIVRGVSGRDVDVEIRGKRMRVRLDSLRAAGGDKSNRPGGIAEPPRAKASVRVGSGAPGPGLPTATRELVLIGSTVDEAIGRAEKFLDQALLADERRLRIVHGHGTGRLRDALRAFFKEHPLVEHVAAAPDNEGGGGATIVELKD